VINKRENSDKSPAKQGVEEVILEPNKIGASTPYDPVTFCYTSLSTGKDYMLSIELVSSWAPNAIPEALDFRSNHL
jgi:hypothetical protein